MVLSGGLANELYKKAGESSGETVIASVAKQSSGENFLRWIASALRASQ
jgi:phosphoribosyl-ATP pyrophosphohydrolase